MRNYYRVSHLTWYIMYLLCISLRMLPFFITLCRSVSVKRTHVNSFYWHNEAVWKLNWKIIHHPWFCWPAVFDMCPGPRGFSWFPPAWKIKEPWSESQLAFALPGPFMQRKVKKILWDQGILYDTWGHKFKTFSKLFSRHLSFTFHYKT